MDRQLFSFSSRFSTPLTLLRNCNLKYFSAVRIKKISLPAQRDEGRTKCRVSKHVAHLVARMFKAFTNLRETTADILSEGSSLYFKSVLSAILNTIKEKKCRRDNTKEQRSMIMTSEMEKNYFKSKV